MSGRKWGVCIGGKIARNQSTRHSWRQSAFCDSQKSNCCQSAARHLYGGRSKRRKKSGLSKSKQDTMCCRKKKLDRHRFYHANGDVSHAGTVLEPTLLATSKAGKTILTLSDTCRIAKSDQSCLRVYRRGTAPSTGSSWASVSTDSGTKSERLRRNAQIFMNSNAQAGKGYEPTRLITAHGKEVLLFANLPCLSLDKPRTKVETTNGRYRLKTQTGQSIPTKLT